VIGQYAVHRTNGQTSTVYRYEHVGPGCRMTLLIRGWIVHGIQLRELDEADAEVRAIDPNAEKQALLRQRATYRSKPAVPIKEGARGIQTPAGPTDDHVEPEQQTE
jgi:hypothetical protein